MFFEFRGRSNKVGIFVDIAVYYGGARCGCVMIPTSSNHSGWCLFTKKLDRFLSSANIVWVEGRTSDDAVGGGPTDGGGQNGKKSFNYGNQKNLRNFENTRFILGHNMIKGDSAVTISNINGRTTHEFIFKLTTANLALRVFKSDRGKRDVSWMDPNNSHMSNKGGPNVLKSEFKHDKAQVANLGGKAHLEVSYPCGLGVSVHSDQSESVVGECSRLPRESVVVSVMPKVLIPDQATKLLASNSMVSHPNREGKTFSEVNPRTTVEPWQPRYLEIVGSRSNPVMSIQ